MDRVVRGLLFCCPLRVPHACFAREWNWHGIRILPKDLPRTICAFPERDATALTNVMKQILSSRRYHLFIGPCQKKPAHHLRHGAFFSAASLLFLEWADSHILLKAQMSFAVRGSIVQSTALLKRVTPSGRMEPAHSTVVLSFTRVFLVRIF